jgi:hypothetical protein
MRAIIVTLVQQRASQMCAQAIVINAHSAALSIAYD